MENKLIYVADDEKNIREAIQAFLINEGFLVDVFENGDLLLDKFKENPADLVILDVMMPGTNGFMVCSALRKISKVPIVMLTARDSDLDYATGLSLGSDDYFTKPFSPMALVMRIKAIFRRIEFERQDDTSETQAVNLSFEDISVDANSKTVKCGSTVLELTSREYQVLYYLMEHLNDTVSRDELLKAIWGYDDKQGIYASDAAVESLREKLASCQSRVEIETVWGYGFRLKGREEDDRTKKKKK